MISFITRRLLLTVFLLIVVSMLTFAIFFLLPRLAGQNAYQLAAQYVGRNPTRGAILQMEAKLGFNQPIAVQYWHFVRGIVAGAHYNDGPSQTYCGPPCFGFSFRTQQPVWPQMMAALPVTLSLAVGAAIMWLLGGVTVGIVSAVRRGSVFDRLSMGVALGAVSLPVFFTAAIILNFFPNIQWVPLTRNPALWAGNLVMPWLVLASTYAAIYARMTRAGMLETMNEDYIRSARSKGLPERTVILRHGLRAALTPILTMFGMDLGLLLGGAVITETVFSLPGLGQFTVLAIQNQDFPEIMGVVLLTSFFIVVANMAVDILYAVVDPRVRLS